MKESKNKSVIFLCHRDGLSNAGTSSYILETLAEYLNEQKIIPHCVISKKKGSDKVEHLSESITYRENFLRNEKCKEAKIDLKLYQEITNNLMSDVNFILLFERNNPFILGNGLFNQFHIIERLIYNIITFLRLQKPDFIFSFAVPHHFINYAIVRIAEIMHIKVYFCDNNGLPWQYYLYHGISNRKMIPNNASKNKVSTSILNWHALQNINYEDSVLLYKKSGGLGLADLELAFLRFKLLFSLFHENRKSGYYFKRNLLSILKSQIMMFKSKKLKNIIEKQGKINLHTEKYFVFFLHYQPEATSMPNAGIYANQLFVIRELSLAMPDGYKLLVREHPFSFENGFSYRYRTKSFYDAINAMKNVKLISLHHDPYELIDSSSGVVTLTGTVGLQAICRGKAVITYGHAAYSSVSGVFKNSSTLNLRNVLKDLASGYIVEERNVINSLTDLERIGFGYLEEGENPYSNQNRERGLDFAVKYWAEKVVNG